MSYLMISCTHGKEDPERAVLPLIVGNTAVSADQDATLFLTIEGVWLGTKGYADDIVKEGFPPLKEILDSFIANGGRVWVCGTCAKPRGITEADLIEGAAIVTAANLVEELGKGAEMVTVG
jgi:uncharacterized protein